LQAVCEEKYAVKMCVEEAAVVVTAVTETPEEPQTTCTITLTSPVMREENQPEGGNALTFVTLVWEPQLFLGLLIHSPT